MLYLVIQTSLFLALASALGFALGFVFHRYFSGRANVRSLKKLVPIPAPHELDTLRERVSALELELDEKDRALKILNSAPAKHTPASPVAPAISLGDMEENSEGDTGEVPLPFPKTVDVLAPPKEQLPVVDTSAEDRAELERLRATLNDREQLVESQAQTIQKLQAAVPNPMDVAEQAERLEDLRNKLEAAEHEASEQERIHDDLVKKFEAKEREWSEAISRLDEVENERSNEKTRPDTDLEELQSYWQTASNEYEDEKRTWQMTEQMLREQIEELRTRLRTVHEHQDETPAPAAIPAVDRKWETRLESIERHCVELADATRQLVHQGNGFRKALDELNNGMGSEGLWSSDDAPMNSTQPLQQQLELLTQKIEALTTTPVLDRSQLDEVALEVAEVTADDEDTSSFDSGGAQVIPMDAHLRSRLEGIERQLGERETSLWQEKSQIDERVEAKLDEMSTDLRRLEARLAEAHAAPQGVSNDLVRGLETLLSEQERTLEAMRSQQHNGEWMRLEARAAQLQRELAEKEQRISQLSTATQRSQEQEHQLRRHVEELRVLLAEKESVITELEKRLGDLSHKVAPELTGEDDLQLIHGIGPGVEKLLHKQFGIRTFRQIALMDEKQAEAISKRLFFAGKIERDDWIGQAMALHHKKYGEELENPAPPYYVRAKI